MLKYITVLPITAIKKIQKEISLPSDSLILIDSLVSTLTSN